MTIDVYTLRAGAIIAVDWAPAGAVEYKLVQLPPVSTYPHDTVLAKSLGIEHGEKNPHTHMWYPNKKQWGTLTQAQMDMVTKNWRCELLTPEPEANVLPAFAHIGKQQPL